MQESKTFFVFYNFLFASFQRKTGILIPDLYLYGIKLQTNIKQNSVEKYARKLQIFEMIFLKKISDKARQ